ncbi:hypothetical protein APED_14945 [Acanthopleuribacter pedis]
MRRALIEESRRGATDSIYKPAFYGALFTCSALATVLVLLLLNPHVLVNNSAEDLGRSPTSNLSRLAEASPLPSFEPVQTGEPTHFYSDRDRRFLQVVDPQNDKAYLEQLFSKKLSTSPGPIRPTNSEKVMVMREFELGTGQRVWVYTEIPPKEPPPHEETSSDFTTL